MSEKSNCHWIITMFELMFLHYSILENLHEGFNRKLRLCNKVFGWERFCVHNWFKIMIVRKNGSVFKAKLARNCLIKLSVTRCLISLRKPSFGITVLWSWACLEKRSFWRWSQRSEQSNANSFVLSTIWNWKTSVTTFVNVYNKFKNKTEQSLW